MSEMHDDGYGCSQLPSPPTWFVRAFSFVQMAWRALIVCGISIFVLMMWTVNPAITIGMTLMFICMTAAYLIYDNPKHEALFAKLVYAGAASQWSVFAILIFISLFGDV